MKEITKKEFINLIESSEKIGITIRVESYIKLCIDYMFFGFNVIEDEIIFYKKFSENHFSFNFNEIRFMGKEGNKITIYLDDAVDTKIEISNIV